MQTPTLTEARRALLELEGPYDSLDYPEYKAKHAIIAAYLDAQVALNVENTPQWVGRVLRQMPAVTETGKVALADICNFVFCRSDRDALKPETGDRRYTPVIIPGSVQHDRSTRMLRATVEFPKGSLLPEELTAFREAITPRHRDPCKRECQCFACMHGGHNKYMAAPDA